MNNKLKRYIGIAAVLILMLAIPLMSEARHRSNRHSSHYSHNRHSGWRFGIAATIPNILFSRAYYGYSQPRPYSYNHQYYNNTGNMWDQGYKDGYRQGRIDAARYGHSRNQGRNYDYRYPGSSSYRQGYREGYSEGFDNNYDRRIARRGYIR